MFDPAPLTIVETPDFIAAARRLFTMKEHELLIDHLARNPDAGDLVPGSGGIRKLRWAAGGRGKRGGARVIYFYCNAQIPLFALDVYAKSEKTDLTHEELSRLRRFVKAIGETYQRKDNR